MATPRQKPQSVPDAVSVHEHEEAFGMTVVEKRERLSSLLYDRWMELLKSDTPVSRRVRTLCTCSALKETRQLAEYALLSDEDGGSKSRER